MWYMATNYFERDNLIGVTPRNRTIIETSKTIPKGSSGVNTPRSNQNLLYK